VQVQCLVAAAKAAMGTAAEQIYVCMARSRAISLKQQYISRFRKRQPIPV
jgi:hypothetical protein